MAKYFGKMAAKSVLFIVGISMMLSQNIFAVMGTSAPEIRNVYVTDQAGNQRSNYTNSERINLNVKVFNSVAGDRVSFRFEIYDPSGVKRFTQTGNSIPGSAGEGGSSLSYIPISNFFTVAGNYKLVVYANTAVKEAYFSVYSPNITLTYPANGMRDLTDKPLVFRWVASGASRYRIYVDDDAAFFNCLFKDDTVSTQYTYPTDPADVRQKLSAGTVYYWKVEALNNAGNIIATTLTPFNFTFKSSAVPPTARDIAVTDISYLNQQVSVSIKNQGGKTESSIPVMLYLGGKPQGTKTVGSISQAETQSAQFAPNVFGTVLAMAIITFDDDNTKNNVLTKQLNIVQYTVTPSTYTPPAQEANGSIHGSVTDASGRKIPGVTVNYESDASHGTAVTDPGGEYKIDGLAQGDYKLSVLADGYASSEQTLTVEKKPLTNVDFKLARSPAGQAGKYDSARTWSAFKKYVKDDEILSELDGYEPFDVQSDSDIEKIISDLDSGAAKITGIELKNE